MGDRLIKTWVKIIDYLIDFVIQFCLNILRKLLGKDKKVLENSGGKKFNEKFS